MRRAGVVIVCLVLAGCGGSGAPSAPEPHVDAEQLARCMINRTASVLADPDQVRMSAALRAAAARGRRTPGTVLPRPGGFAAFAGAGRNFVPAGFDASDFVPAAFVFFPDAGAAREHEGDADERHGNLLVVYDGTPSDGEKGLVAQCLRKVGG
jgi:hypothetical protein